ncbi:zyxin-like [Convolutriloba macropyga]|uniref:zyxin-like n=1 Tax=Convolutriloba macropyga TaxID=536237 RepID=UPI003F5249EC
MTSYKFVIKNVCMACELPFNSLAEKVPGWAYHYRCFICKACQKVIEGEYLADASSQQNFIYCMSCGENEFREALASNPDLYFHRDRVRKVRHGKVLPLVGIKKKMRSGLHLN